MSKIPEIYGSMVFNEHTMQERLPSATYKDLMRTIKKGEPLNLEVANVVAHAMKEWAIEKGATHYTHWFQPLSGMGPHQLRVHQGRGAVHPHRVLQLHRRGA